MLQQIIALIIIFWFLGRLFWQKRNNKIRANEFRFWLVFWFISALAVLFLKQIDNLVARLGFSGSGIEVLLYLAIALLFYLVFRMNIKQERIERDLTKIVRHLSIKKD